MLALLIFWICPDLRGTLLAVAIAATFAVGVWVATEVEKTDGHDASIINIDEVAGMWLSLFLLPVSAGFLWHIGGFLLFRIFDIVKPPPANQSQNLPKGWGVMTDDIIAGIYANLSLRLIFFFFGG